MDTETFVSSMTSAPLEDVEAELARSPALANARKSRDGQTALGAAVKADRAALVEVLLQAGADPNARNVAGVPAHALVASIAVATILETHGVEWASDGGRTALYLSLDGPPELTEWLLARGVVPDFALLHRCEFRPELLRRVVPRMEAALRPRLLSAALGLNADGSSPNEEECCRRVQTLLDLGFDPNTGSALHDAAADDRAEVVALLVAAGADPNRQDEHGDLPAVVAAVEGSTRALEALLDSGASAREIDATGTSVETVAEQSPSVRNVLAAHRSADGPSRR